MKNVRVAMFYHSLVSDWNHGNAHFLRGIATELQADGCDVRVYEPEQSWSRDNLISDHGHSAVERFHAAFPNLTSHTYKSARDVESLLDSVDLALIHEWNQPDVIAAAGRVRRSSSQLRLFFHDTHHRAITAQHEMSRFDLQDYDGVLAYGASLKRAYERFGWGRHVYVWHEAADTRVFHPRRADRKEGDIVWIGNWGDEERTDELREFLIGPIADLGLKARMHGVRYPSTALEELTRAGIEYGGWLPNFEAPEVFARFTATLHVPRRPYTQQLAGIPTIRPFEALACGIPLISSPWSDEENLFRVGRDFLMVKNGSEMKRQMSAVLNDNALRNSLIESGLETIRSRHTCRHRVNELMHIYESVAPASSSVEQLSEVRA